MKKKSILLCVILASIIGAFFIYKYRKVDVGYNLTEPEKYPRIFLETTNFEMSFNDSKFETLPVVPMGLKSDGEDFYTIDFAEMVIFRYTAKGELINKIGNGIGKGPGEMAQISDFYLSEEYVWVSDPNQFMIHKFSKEGIYIDSRILKSHPTRIADDSLNLVVMSVGSPDGIFQSISKDFSNQNSKVFGGFMSRNNLGPLSLDGWLEKREESGFIYVPRLASLAYYFNINNNLDFIVKTPDGENYKPNLDRSEGEEKRFTLEDRDKENLWVDMYNDKLYILALDRGDRNSNGEYITKSKVYIDIYDKNGEYLNSFIPPATEYFTILDGKFVSLYNSTIRIYRIEGVSF